MRWRLFTGLCVLSAVGLVATAVLWVRSYWVHDSIAFSRGRETFDEHRWSHGNLWVYWSYDLSSHGGGLRFSYGETTCAILADDDYSRLAGYQLRWRRFGNPGYPILRQPDRSALRRIGVDWIGQVHPPHRVTMGGCTYAMTLPHWFVAMIMAVSPGWWVARWIRMRRRQLGGLCVGCGYDLRASSGRCPECGRRITEG